MGWSSAEKPQPRTGSLNRLDASIFEDNEEAFAMQLLTSGLMYAYSDATRMVEQGHSSDDVDYCSASVRDCKAGDYKLVERAR